ncbi:hypothetical protein [Microcoleus sp. F4-D5]|uniref:hypothetical protein n=1 Tax=Microcoleus sp. F4-D5 TaxID=2818760 RepID=UPI002FD57CF9
MSRRDLLGTQNRNRESNYGVWGETDRPIGCGNAKIVGSGRVVEPLSSWHFCQEYDRLNTEQFQQFIDALSHQLGDDIALIQLERAGAHVTSAQRMARQLDSPVSTGP